MLDSRTHAALDWTLCGALAALAVLPGRERLLSGAAALAVAGLSGVTDYEGGVAPLVPLVAHRAAEAASGAVLLAAGLRGRRLLGLIGAAQLALAALSAPRAEGGPPDAAYRPLGVLKPFADGVWIVDEVMNGLVPIRMTVLRLPGGELLLHSPTMYRPGLRAALEAIGPIRHLVAPSIAHWMFAKAWQDAVPGAVTWAAPNLRERGQVRRAGLKVDHVLGGEAPPEWGGAVDVELIRGHGGYRELAFFHRPSRTAVMTDIVQNFEREKMPWPLRPIARLLGNVAPISQAPAYLRALVGQQDRAAARRIVDWAPERLLVTHGRPVKQDAAGRLRRSLSWLTR